MLVVTGIISFPTLFTPRIPKGSDKPKYSCVILLPPSDPQVAIINAAVEQAKLDPKNFPNGYDGTNVCFDAYDVKFQGSGSYDPRFSGWYAFNCSSKADDKPAVVDANHQPIIDPGAVRAGMLVHVNAGISGYNKGTGGIGGWLNGVMITGEMGTMGDLSGRPSVEQMFAGVGAPPQAAAPAPVAAPAPTPAPNFAAPAPAPAPAGPVMTAAANGVTYEQYIEAGWDDEQLRSNGLMQ